MPQESSNVVPRQKSHEKEGLAKLKDQTEKTMLLSKMSGRPSICSYIEEHYFVRAVVNSNLKSLIQGNTLEICQKVGSTIPACNLHLVK